MPVRRYRDVSEMPGPQRVDPKGPELWRHIAAWMALSSRLSGRRWPPGVYKNRSIEEANRRRDSWRLPAGRDP
jgi:hypothetical protein